MIKQNIDNKISEYIDRADAIIGSNQVACKRDLGANAWVEIAKMIQVEEHAQPIIECVEVVSLDKFDLQEFNKEKERVEKLYEMGAITTLEKVNYLRTFVGLKELDKVPYEPPFVIFPKPRPTPNQGQTITKGVDIPSYWILIVFGIIIVALIAKNCI